MGAQFDCKDSLAIIRIDNPPVNGLSHASRAAIAAHLSDAQANEHIKAIILTGSLKAFSGGADIKEFGTEKTYAKPSLPDLIGQIESMSKPVIALINGVCMGGGLELALACHYRLAHQDALIALPEVKLGLLPGAGGTQRLPRVVGYPLALHMITTGQAMKAGELCDQPGVSLFEQVYETQESLEIALNFANQIADLRPLPLIRAQSPVAVSPDIFAQARAALAQKSRGLLAPLRCIDAIEACSLSSFDQGLQTERALFQELLNSDQSKALRHAFLAERLAGKIEGLQAEVQPRRIQSIAVIGAGTMGAGIAMSFANAGYPVQILDMQSAALESAQKRIRQLYQAAVSKGKLSEKECEARCQLISTTSDYADIADADLVIEAVFESMDVKEAVFKALDSVMKPGAILASNTSTLDLNRIALFTQRPEDVVGLHFFSPAHIMELLEIVRGAQTSDAVLATCLELAKLIKKIAVVAGVCDGFIGNRMLEQYTKQAAFLLEEGCTPQQVDRAIENFGFAMGPFRMNDLAGNDISWAIRKRRREQNPQALYSRLGDLLCEQARYGQKTNAGWYDYREGERKAIPSAWVENLIQTHATEQGFLQRAIEDEEIVERLVFALANEGRKIRKEGIAMRASDIDIVYLKGYGFPKHHGGPMYYTENLGWDYLDQKIAVFAQGHRGESWN